MSDVLSKIKSRRNRTTVPAREDSLIRKELPVSESLTEEINDREFVKNQRATEEFGPSSINQVEVLRGELEKYPEIIRHSAIRLEKELDNRLTRFCKDSGCTIETFLEAAFEAVEVEPNLRDKVLSSAKKRYASRKKAGKLRQLITQLEKVGR